MRLARRKRKEIGVLRKDLTRKEGFTGDVLPGDASTGEKIEGGKVKEGVAASSCHLERGERRATEDGEGETCVHVWPEKGSKRTTKGKKSFVS